VNSDVVAKATTHKDISDEKLSWSWNRRTAALVSRWGEDPVPSQSRQDSKAILPN